jgi:pimeloyl-ACP methyl ester carboxylesterase
MTNAGTSGGGPAGGGALAPPERLTRFGLVRNRPHQGEAGFVDCGSYRLAVVEFDDQGCCYDRAQLAKVSAALQGMMTREEDAIFLLFVHGWKHDGRSNDSNLIEFRTTLAATARHEAALHAASGGSGPGRIVYGIFVGWRGLSWHGFGLENLTFWGRQRAGQRVATGSVRELFGRLRHYRNHRANRDGQPLIVIVGHSFGGMIVYSALAQSLIEAASAAADEIVPRFADLVLLINPAIEAARYLPVHCLVRETAIAARTLTQLPVFVCATARNDRATHYAFPLGNLTSLISENTRGRLERRCLINTIGHVPDLETHRLTKGPGHHDYALAPGPGPEQPNPFWVVAAEPEVIDGHDGIFKAPFLSFLASLIFAHVEQSREGATETVPKRI